jgi:hypothetical protein
MGRLEMIDQSTDVGMTGRYSLEDGNFIPDLIYRANVRRKEVGLRLGEALKMLEGGRRD